jgi:hypothetical protein
MLEEYRYSNEIYIPLNVVVDEVTHYNELQKLHYHNPLTDKRLQSLCGVI